VSQTETKAACIIVLDYNLGQSWQTNSSEGNNSSNEKKCDSYFIWWRLYAKVKIVGKIKRRQKKDEGIRKSSDSNKYF